MKSRSKRADRKRNLTRKVDKHDVIVVGGGPAGSVMAWALARRGINVLLLEQARFPREKVCGDFVEPRGLRILKNLGCLGALENSCPLPINSVAMFVESRCAYQGRIPFYGRHRDLLPHGYIIPRDVLDHEILRCADRAGAIVRQESTVTSVKTTPTGVEVAVREGVRTRTVRSALVVGADGVNSIVAKRFGLLVSDPRHIAVSQRAYVEGLKASVGEAAFFFDRDLFPGYGWMFPMAEGAANIGVGILSETRNRYDINVPILFQQFVEKLRNFHPYCRKLRVSQKPIGGIVKTYGAAGQNFFDRGVLVGDAGCFVDPMTGEGITPAMESALIGSSVLAEALENGRTDAEFLSCYALNFRRYFDPGWCHVDLCASLMRNRHFGNAWLKAVARGCELASEDSHFAQTAGAVFGGMEIDPFRICAQIWAKTTGEFMSLGAQSMFGLMRGNVKPMLGAWSELIGWQASWWKSVVSDPLWHASWVSDVSKKWMKVMSVFPSGARDPRAAGVIASSQAWKKK